MRRLLIALLFTSLGLGVAAQDLPIFSHYIMNPYMINPAYAGSEGRGTLFLTHRRQWVGIDGAPVTSNLTFHTPLTKGLMFGLNLTNDERSILNTSTALLTFGYSAQLGSKTFIRFAISGGAGYNSIDLDQANLNDPAVANILADNLFLEGNTGISLHFGNFNIGATLPKIFNTNIVGLENFEVGDIDPLKEMLFNINHRFFFGDNFAFEPRVIYRMSDFPEYDSYEASAVFHIKNAIWLGAAYREDYGISGLIGFKIKNSFGIGYAANLGPTEFNGIDNATHEVQIALGLGKIKPRQKPKVYSFINLDRTLKPTNILLASSSVDENQPSGTQVGTLSTTDKDSNQHTYALVSGSGSDDNSSFRISGNKLNTGRQFDYEDKDRYTVRISTTDEAGLKYEKSFTITINDVEEREPVAPTDIILANNSVNENQPAGTTVGNLSTTDEDSDQHTYSLVSGDGSDDNASFSITGNQVNTNESFDYETKSQYSVRISSTDADGLQFEKSFSIFINKVEDVDPRKDSVITDPIERDSVVTDPITEDSVTVDEDDRPVIVQRGDHLLELPVGHYVIVGAYGRLENAQGFSDAIFQMGYKSSFGFLTAKNLYYVWVHQGTSAAEARSVRDEFRKNQMFKDAWYLLVQ